MNWIIILGRVNVIAYYAMSVLSVPLIIIGHFPIWQPLVFIAGCLSCAMFTQSKLRQLEKDRHG